MFIKGIHEHVIVHVHVFFVEDKSLAGWCVVLKKEARGKHINSTKTEYELWQEESIGDRLAFWKRRQGKGGGMCNNLEDDAITFVI